MEVQLANPRGFCAGVDRAIEIVERALEIHGAPVYVLHEIVHNRHVIDDLRTRGVRFVEELAEVPDGGVAIFSAHGVSDQVEQEGHARKLFIVDATCPLVTKVHNQARTYEREERELVLIGHEGHPEVEGTRGRATGRVTVLSTIEAVERFEPLDPLRLAYVTQTTLSLDDTREVVDALVRRFPAIKGPDLKDICYATQNRQNAVREMVEYVDVLIVVGSRNSSNSSRLREMGERTGIPSYLIDDPADLDPAWVAGKTRVGMTAGASAPEVLVQQILERLRSLGVTEVHELEGEPETTVFRMPPELERMANERA